MSKKPLIVGIDPGNTSAVAAFNFDGEIELLESRKEFSTDQMINRLVQTGIPVVVASDREKMPSTVEKIARSLGARKFEPSNDLSSGRKEELGRGENSHEVDAYASGMYAYNSLKRKIQKVKSISDTENKDVSEVAKKYFSRDSIGSNPSESN